MWFVRKATSGMNQFLIEKVLKILLSEFTKVLIQFDHVGLLHTWLFATPNLSHIRHK